MQIAGKDLININVDDDMLPKLRALSKDLKKHEQKIVKIQSTFRMHKVFKNYNYGRINIKEFESINKKSRKSLREVATEFRGLTKFRYFGKKVNSKREGFGIVKWSASSKFTGIFVNDTASGYGKLRHDNNFYSGEFKYNKANGYGKCIGPDKIHYEGIWRDENLSGIGLEEFDGNKYEGNYINGQKHGVGKYIWKDSSEYYGDWVNNSMQGCGIYTFTNGGLYMGEFHENMMSGYGEYILNDKTYIGNFLNDNRHGFGIDFLNNPIRIYVGFWFEGKKDGLGKILTSDSVSFCYYENGKKTKIIQNYSDAIFLIPKEYSRYRRFFKMNVQKLMKIKNRN